MILGMLFSLIFADVLLGGIDLAITWMFWREHVRFKRRYSYSDPMGFFEYRDRFFKRWAA